MPLRYEISIERRLARVFGQGAADTADLLRIMEDLVDEPAFATDLDVVADLREVRLVPTFTEIRRIAKMFAQVRSHLPPRVAFLVSDPRQLRLGRFAAALAGALRFELAVFESDDQAAVWLEETPEQRDSDLRRSLHQLWSKPLLAALATVAEGHQPRVRYLVTVMDDELRLRAATPVRSRKVAELEKNPRVEVTAGASELATAEVWARMTGEARVSHEPADKQAVWHESLAAFFDGPNDPELAVLVIEPLQVELYQMTWLHPRTWRSAG